MIPSGADSPDLYERAADAAEAEREKDEALAAFGALLIGAGLASVFWIAVDIVLVVVL